MSWSTNQQVVESDYNVVNSDDNEVITGLTKDQAEAQVEEWIDEGTDTEYIYVIKGSIVPFNTSKVSISG